MAMAITIVVATRKSQAVHDSVVALLRNMGYWRSCWSRWEYGGSFYALRRVTVTVTITVTVLRSCEVHLGDPQAFALWGSCEITSRSPRSPLPMAGQAHYSPHRKLPALLRSISVRDGKLGCLTLQALGAARRARMLVRISDKRGSIPRKLCCLRQGAERQAPAGFVELARKTGATVASPPCVSLYINAIKPTLRLLVQ
jgi:hypothetical protein